MSRIARRGCPFAGLRSDDAILAEALRLNTVRIGCIRARRDGIGPPWEPRLGFPEILDG